VCNRVKADHFVQGLRKEYDSRHRHSRQAPRQHASHAGSTLTSPDHDQHLSLTHNWPAMQHHGSGRAQMLQHSQVGDHKHHQLAVRPDRADNADHGSLLKLAASCQLFTASNTVWQVSLWSRSWSGHQPIIQHCLLLPFAADNTFMC
jgi:hypothetical protein